MKLTITKSGYDSSILTETEVAECKPAASSILATYDFPDMLDPVTLTGSEKQVEWARSIRYKALQHALIALAKGGVPQSIVDVLALAVGRATEAKWWIDNRDSVKWQKLMTDFALAEFEAARAEVTN